MTPEQKQRIEQIEKWQESRRGLVDSARKHADLDASHPEIRMHGYIDFLLCLVSQETVSVRAAAEAATLRLCKAQEVITGLLDLRVPKQREGFQIWLEDAMTGVATSMRSACVEEVKALRAKWLELANKQPGWCQHVRAADSIITALKSVSIQGRQNSEPRD